jgi:hypothetical protein
MNLLKTFRDVSNKLTPGNDLPAWFLGNKIKGVILSGNRVKVLPVNAKMVIVKLWFPISAQDEEITYCSLKKSTITRAIIKDVGFDMVKGDCTTYIICSVIGINQFHPFASEIEITCMLYESCTEILPVIEYMNLQGMNWCNIIMQRPTILLKGTSIRYSDLPIFDDDYENNLSSLLKVCGWPVV